MRDGDCTPIPTSREPGERAPCIKLKLQREPSAKQNFLLLSAEWKPNRRCKALQAQTIRGSCCLSLRRPQHHHRASRTLTTFKCSGNIPVLKPYGESQITDSALSYRCKSAYAGKGHWYLGVFYRKAESLLKLKLSCPIQMDHYKYQWNNVMHTEISIAKKT